MLDRRYPHLARLEDRPMWLTSDEAVRARAFSQQVCDRTPSLRAAWNNHQRAIYFYYGDDCQNAAFTYEIAAQDDVWKQDDTQRLTVAVSPVGRARVVEGGQGLIQQQQTWLRDQGAGNGHALTLAPRQLVAVALEQVANAQQLNGLLHHGLAHRVATLLFSTLVAIGQVARDIQVVEQGRFLKHIAQGALVRGQANVVYIVLPHLVAQLHHATRRRF